MLKTNRNNKMEKRILALAFACMSMFAREQKDENDSESSKAIRDLHKIGKDITDNFPSIFRPASELNVENPKDPTEEV